MATPLPSPAPLPVDPFVSDADRRYRSLYFPMAGVRQVRTKLTGPFDSVNVHRRAKMYRAAGNLKAAAFEERFLRDLLAQVVL